MAGPDAVPARPPARCSACPAALPSEPSAVEAQEVSQPIAQLCPWHHHVDLAAAELEVGALKAGRQGCVSRLLDDAGPGEPDRSPRLSDVDVPLQRKRGWGA